MKKITLITIFLISVAGQAQVLLSENFDTALNWTVTHTTGTSTLPGWARVTTGVYPTCTNFAGAGMAQFNSYDIDVVNKYTLRSPAITFSGQFYNVKYSMYRDAQYGTNQDNLKIYYNTTASLTGATLLQTTYRSSTIAPTVATNGWYNYTANIPYGVTGTGYIIILGTTDYGNNIYLDSVSVEQNSTVNDAALDNFNFSSVVALGIYPINGTITNTASNTITSLDISWQVGAGTVNNQTLTGLNILPGASYNFSCNLPWNASTSGATTLTVTVSNTNGGDSNASNNTIIKNINVVNEIFSKTVVYEEGTGTWCGWCVRGHVGLKDMAHNHPATSFIGIAVHNQDPMAVPAYDAAIGTFIAGYPSGIINRNIGEVDPGLTTLESAYQAELAKIPLAKINIPDANWNATTRQITFNADAKFALDLTNANYNLASIIIENGVKGTTAAYGQKNYYSGGGNGPLIDWEGINWSNYASTIPAATMVYNHVGRTLLGGFTGYAGSIPSSVSYNSTYTYAFSHTLSPVQNINNIEVVAIIIDNATGLIVNANNFDLGAKVILANNTFQTNAKFSVAPNPSTGTITINTEKTVRLSVIDVLGKVVYTNDQVDVNTNIDLSNLQKGIYLVKVIGDNVYSTEKLILK